MAMQPSFPGVSMAAGESMKGWQVDSGSMHGRASDHAVLGRVIGAHDARIDLLQNHHSHPRHAGVGCNLEMPKVPDLPFHRPFHDSQYVWLPQTSGRASPRQYEERQLPMHPYPCTDFFPPDDHSQHSHHRIELRTFHGAKQQEPLVDVHMQRPCPYARQDGMRQQNAHEVRIGGNSQEYYAYSELFDVRGQPLPPSVLPVNDHVSGPYMYMHVGSSKEAFLSGGGGAGFP
jgi:hypothetical protein